MLTESPSKYAIKTIDARQILDSRGEPTVECEISTSRGKEVVSVPSGASKGKYEAIELRDGRSAFHGKSVSNAVNNIEKKIAPELVGKNCRKQQMLDKLMLKLDGTENKKNLGANALLAVSLAIAKVAANTESIPLFQYLSDGQSNTLPIPLMNVINGGEHAGNELDIQEFWIIPSGAETFWHALQWGCEIYYTLEKKLKEEFGSIATNVGDEGGFAPPIQSTDKVFDLLETVIEESGFEVGTDILFGLDAAATDFYNYDKEIYEIDGKQLSKGEMLHFYENLRSSFPIKAIEDPFHEDDFMSFSALTKEVGEDCLIIGDDLFTTNPRRLKKGINVGAGNALIIKPNQIGTLTETLKVAEIARKAEYKMIISHRSGETTDTFISDLAVALNSGLIKTGAPARGERVSKYNRLLRIREKVSDPKYPDFQQVL